MTHRTCVVVLVLVATSLVAGFAQTTQLIGWAEDMVLSWSMFQGSPPPDAGPNEIASIYVSLKWAASQPVAVGAKTSAGWTVRASFIEVSNSMNPRFSWARHDRVTDAALRHEAYHFNLYEVYRRKLESAIGSTQATHPDQAAVCTLLWNTIQATADALTDRADALQDTYDTETNHGHDATAQAQWEAQIDAWLANPDLAP